MMYGRCVASPRWVTDRGEYSYQRDDDTTHVVYPPAQIIMEGYERLECVMTFTLSTGVWFDIVMI